MTDPSATGEAPGERARSYADAVFFPLAWVTWSLKFRSILLAFVVSSLGFMAYHYLGTSLQGWLHPELADRSAAEWQAFWTIATFTTLLATVNYFLFIYFARSFGEDLDEIAERFGEDAVTIEAHDRVWWPLVMAIAITPIMIGLTALAFDGITVSEFITRFFVDRLDFNTRNPYLTTTLWHFPFAIVAITAFAILDRASTTLTRIAGRIEIDLVAVHDLSIISSPLIRVLTIGIIGLTVILMTYVNADVWAIMSRTLLPLHALWITVTTLPFLYPAVVLQRRIRSARDAELDRITAALRGDKAALNGTRFATLQAQHQIDILTYQQIMLQQWTFPIEAHARQLLILGFVPPVTWVLAAVVENALY